MDEPTPQWNANYDEVADSFGYFTDLVTTPLAAAMVRLANLSPGQQVLDVGTGTGIVSLNAAREISPTQGSVTGIDVSRGQLAVAQRKSTEAGLADRIRFVLGDAETLPFPDSHFDVVVSLFALFHFPHPPKALTEIFRVLKPGGRMVMGVGAGPPWTSWKGWLHRLRRSPDLIRLRSGRLRLAPAQLEHFVARHLVVAQQAKVSGLTRDYWFRGKRSEGLIADAGFSRVRVDWEGSRLVLADARQFWDLQRTFSSPARTALAAATPEEVERVRSAFLADCQRVQMRGGSLEYHSAALMISGYRP